MSKQISKQQVLEWTENPVTISLKLFVEKELEDIKQTSITECLCYSEPQKTQENLVELEARERVWADLAALLGGDWTYFEEDDD